MSSTTDTGSMTHPQRRMLLQSLIGKRALAQVGTTTHDLAIVGLAVDGSTSSPTLDKAVTLVATVYGEDNRLIVIPMNQIRWLSPCQWRITDPRHPDYEHPGRVVTPAVRRRR